MPNKPDDRPTPDAGEDNSLAYQQALRYGQDLQRIYLIEKARRQELELANSLLNTVFDSAPDGLMVLDESYTVLALNPALARLMETTREALVGMPLAEAFPAEAAASLLECLSGPRTDEITAEIIIKEPVTRLLAVSAARLEASTQPGWVLSFRDQTDRRRLEYQKVEFINIAAHELRTPLTSVIGLSELLREMIPLDDPDVRECVEGVVRGAHRLSNIVDQLIQFAQLTEGHIHSGEETTLLPLVEEVVASVETQAKIKNVSIHLDAPIDPATPVPGSPMLLRAALVQLLLNGINFNKQGGSVRVRLTTSDDALAIDIVDTGIGIPQAEMETIFQPFVQVEDHNIRHVGGLGLGLSIVKHVVARLQGSLKVDSQLDEGTHVQITIPFYQPEQDELAAMQARLDSSNRQLLSYAQDLRRLHVVLDDTFVGMLNVLLSAAAAQDANWRAQFDHLTALIQRVADEMELSERDRNAIRVAAAIHELRNSRSFENIAWLSSLDTPSAEERSVLLLNQAQQILKAADEQYDGSGPFGLAGRAIPLGARLLAAVDAYTHLNGIGEASHEAAAEALKAQAGTVYDPEIVDALLRATEGES